MGEVLSVDEVLEELAATTKFQPVQEGERCFICRGRKTVKVDGVCAEK